MSSKRKKMFRAILFYTFILFIGAVASVYIASSFSFRSKFFPNTTINGVDVGQMDAENAEKAVYEGMSIKILLRPEDGYEVINASEIDYNYVLEPTVGELLKQQDPWKWGISLIHPVQYITKITPSYDEAKLMSEIEGLKCLNITAVAPQNARIEKTDTEFKIIPETEGTQLDEEQVKIAVIKAIEEGRSEVDLVKEGCYLAPTVTENDPTLIQEYSHIQDIISKNVEVDLTDATEVIDKKTIFDWVSYKNGEVILDMDAIDHYMAGLEEKYMTFQTERPFTTTKGDTIKVGGYETDTYGFWLDRKQTKDDICEAVLAGTDQKVAATWRIPALHRNTKNGDIGDTYIEVCIDDQHLWYYKSGRLVMDTPVITGKNIDETRTPVGLYRVIEKKELQPDGYTIPAPDWMVFTLDGTALCGATWRASSEFNDTTYILNGSNKDVEIPAESAKTLFKSVQIDTPVIIY